MKHLRRILKWVGWLQLTVILVYTAYFVYSMKTGEKRVTELCSQITPGKSFSEVKTFAVDHGIDGPRLRIDADSTVAYLAERRTMGRHTCRLEFEAGDREEVGIQVLRLKSEISCTHHSDPGTEP